MNPDVFSKHTGLAAALILLLLWAAPAPAVAQGDPQVALTTNQQTYVPGDVFVLHAQIEQGTQNPVVDGWVWVDIPGGTRAYLRSDLMTFGGAPAPTTQNLTVVDFSGPIFQMPVPGFLPPGTYTFSAAGATPGFTPFDPIYQASNIATVSVELTVNDGVALFAGAYSGTYAGDDHGTFMATIDTDGRISGSGVSLLDGTEFTVAGTVTASGAFVFATGSSSTGATFSGTISPSGEMSGTWVNPFYDESGTFRGNKQE